MNDILQNALVEHYVNSKGLITEQDVGTATFQEWKNVVEALYTQAIGLNAQDWDNPTELKAVAISDQIWDILRKVYEDIVGEVNGSFLQRDTSIVCLIVAYAIKKHKPMDGKKLSNQEAFRLKWEHYLAREIMIQRSKSIMMIEDDRLDRNAIRSLRKRRRIKLSRESEMKIDKGKIDFSETLEENCDWNDDSVLYIYKGRTSCHTRNHEMEQATAIFTGRNDLDIKLNIEHCKKCGKFYMSYSVYERYREKYGMLLGKIKMDSASTVGLQDIVLSELSPLKLCGYSVNQQDGYSKAERQYIISKVIEKGVLRKSEVVRYLEYFINRNGQKSSNALALKKWKEDLDFTLKFKISEQAEHQIKHIKKY